MQMVVDFSDVKIAAPHLGSVDWKHTYERSPVTMKSTTPKRIRVRRFITDRYAYRTQPDYLSELVLFGIIMVAASWPIFVLATAMAGTLR